MADESGFYRMKRGSAQPNPIKQSKLRIRLVYPPYLTNSITERPAKDIDYVLAIQGKKRYELKGKTNGDGILEEAIPTDVKSATLTLCMAKQGDKKSTFWKIRLEIGPLGSVHTLPGEIARQNNLGLFAAKGLSSESGQFMRARDRFIGLFGVPDGTMIENRIEEVYGS